MNPSTARVIIRWTGVATALFTGAGIALLVATLDTPLPDRWGPRGFPAIFALTFGIVGTILTTRHPRNAIGWLFLVNALLSGIQVFNEEYVTSALIAHPDSLPWARIALWTSNWFWMLVIAPIALVFLLFPSGRFLSVAWKRFAIVSIAALALGTALVALTPGRMADMPFENPYSWSAIPVGVTNVAMLPVAVLFTGSMACLVRRFGHSRGHERQQLKWVAAAALLAGVILPLSLVTPEIATTDSVEIAVILSFMALPISMGIAILRYRLYDIDVVINRTIVYVVLTALLAGIYVGAVTLLQTVLPVAGNDLAVAGSTLAVAALFNPLRRQIQGFIDHHFYRRKYDAQRTIDGFAARLRDEIHIEALSRELVAVVDATMQPSHVSVWLREPERVAS